MNAGAARSRVGVGGCSAAGAVSAAAAAAAATAATGMSMRSERLFLENLARSRSDSALTVTGRSTVSEPAAPLTVTALLARSTSSSFIEATAGSCTTSRSVSASGRDSACCGDSACSG